MRSLFLAAAAVMLLAACGTRGPLTQPPPGAATKATITLVDNSSKPQAGGPL